MMDLDQRLRDHFEVAAADLPVPPLDPAAPVRRARRRRQNRMAAGAAAVVLAVVGVGIGVALITGDEEGSTIVDDPDVTVPTTTTSPGSTTTTTTLPPEERAAPSRVDVREAVSVFDYGGDGGFGVVMEGDADALWVTRSREDRTGDVLRIGPATGEVTATVVLPGGLQPVGLLAGAGMVWVPAWDGQAHRVDPATGEVVASVVVFEDNGGSWFGGGAVAADGVWLSQNVDPRVAVGELPTNVMRRIDPADNTIAAFIPHAGAMGRSPVAAGGDAVWVVTGGMLNRLDRFSDEAVADVVAAIEVPGRPITDVSADQGSVWAMGDSFVARIDPATNEIVTTIELPGPASDTALVDGGLLIAAGRELFRVDVATEALTTVLDLGPDGPDAQHLTLTDSHLWFTAVGSGETLIGRLPLNSLTGSFEGVSSEDAEPAIVSGADALGVVQEQFGFTGVGSRDDLVAVVDLGAETQDLFGLAVADGSLWTQRDVSHVLRIDPASREVQAVVDLPELQTEEPIPVGGGQAVGIGSFTPVFEAFDAVWASTGDGRLHRIDPVADGVVASIDLRDVLGDMWGVGQQGFSFDVTADADSLWIWPGHGLPLRIDPDTNTVVAAGEVAGAALRSQAPGWVAVGNRVQRVDPETGQVEVTFELPSEGSGLNNSRTVWNLVVTDDGIWVVARASLARIDPSTNRVAATLPLSTASGGGAAALVDDALLVAYGGTVFHIDTTTDTVVGAVGVGVSIEDLAVVGDELWMVGPPLQIGGCSPCEWRASMSRIPLSAVLGSV